MSTVFVHNLILPFFHKVKPHLFQHHSTIVRKSSVVNNSAKNVAGGQQQKCVNERLWIANKLLQQHSNIKPRCSYWSSHYANNEIECRAQNGEEKFSDKNVQLRTSNCSTYFSSIATVAFQIVNK